VVYALLVHPEVYPGWYMPSLLHYPGYTPVHTCPSPLPVIAVLGVTLPGGEALGSKRRIVRDTEAQRASLLPKV